VVETAVSIQRSSSFHLFGFHANRKVLMAAPFG
jgi:hypothetical protein